MSHNIFQDIGEELDANFAKNARATAATKKPARGSNPRRKRVRWAAKPGGNECSDEGGDESVVGPVVEDDSVKAVDVSERAVDDENTYVAIRLPSGKFWGHIAPGTSAVKVAEARAFVDEHLYCLEKYVLPAGYTFLKAIEELYPEVPADFVVALLVRVQRLYSLPLFEEFVAVCLDKRMIFSDVERYAKNLELVYIAYVCDDTGNIRQGLSLAELNLASTQAARYVMQIQRDHKAN